MIKTIACFIRHDGQFESVLNGNRNLSYLYFSLCVGKKKKNRTNDTMSKERGWGFNVLVTMTEETIGVMLYPSVLKKVAR